MDVIRWRRIIIHEVAQIKEHLVDDTRAYVNQLPPHGKETYEGRICPNVPLLRHIGQLSHDPNIAELMDYDAGGLTLLGRLHQGECWDRQPDWLLARPLDKSAFFTTQRKTTSRMQSRHDRRHDSDSSLALLEVVLQERDEAQLSESVSGSALVGSLHVSSANFNTSEIEPHPSPMELSRSCGVGCFCHCHRQ